MPSTSITHRRWDRVGKFTMEQGARDIFHFAIGWKDRNEQDEILLQHPPEILQLTHLYLEWDASSWNEFQDDAYATALNVLAHTSNNLKFLSIKIVGPARFTEYDYVLATPEAGLPKDLLKRSMPELCSTSTLSRSKNIIERPSIDLQQYGARFHGSRKSCIVALLSLRNIPVLDIEGPMEIQLRRKIFGLITEDPDSSANRLGAGLEPSEVAGQTEMIAKWEEEMLTFRLGEDVVRICTSETVDDVASDKEDESAREEMFGARKAGAMLETRLSDKEKEWVLPTSMTARVVIGWRASGKIPAWNGPQED